MQRFRRSTVNCLQRLPQLSIGNCQVDSAAVPVNCFGFIEAGHDVAAPPPLLLLLLLLLMLMLVLFVQLTIYYKQIYVHSWLYIQSVDRLFVCLLNSCNLRFQLAAWQTSFFGQKRHAWFRGDCDVDYLRWKMCWRYCRSSNTVMLYGYMVFTHLQLLISRGRLAIDVSVRFNSWFDFPIIDCICVRVCVRFICKLTEVYSLHFISSETTKMQSQCSDNSAATTLSLSL